MHPSRTAAPFWQLKIEVPSCAPAPPRACYCCDVPVPLADLFSVPDTNSKKTAFEQKTEKKHSVRKTQKAKQKKHRTLKKGWAQTGTETGGGHFCVEQTGAGAGGRLVKGL